MSFFDNFTRSAWRLETHSFYTADADEFYQALVGESPTAAQQAQRQQWINQVVQAVAAGRVIGRVLVIDRPPSSYWQWRMATAHIAAGEQVYVAGRGGHPALAARGDFWLFDEQRVLPLSYDFDGTFMGASGTADPMIVARYRQHRDLAVAHSVPLLGTVPAA